MDALGSNNQTSRTSSMVPIGALLEYIEPREPVLQGVWESVRVGQERVLQSFYLPAVCALLTHLLLCAPFLLLDGLGGVSPRVRAWRLQAGSGPPPALRCWLQCFWRVCCGYATVVLPVTALIQTVHSPGMPDSAPSCWELFVEVMACFLLFDTFFFIWHYSMHRIPWLYRRVHRAHHQHHVPFAMAAQDASSAELLSLLLLALGSAALVDAHPLSEVLFHLLNAWLAVEDHCGYNLPFALHNLLPCMGGTPFHQAHHIQQNGNYAPYFTHWDRLFGTYRAPLRKQRTE